MRVLTFGEAMLRLSPPAGSSLEKADQYRVEIAGAEANVAIALARLGLEAAWVSRLPRNELGRRIAARVREHGVDTDHIVWTDDGRVGLYFVEVGLSPRPTHVIYDRAHSAFAAMTPEDLDLGMLDGVDLLHVTGITPALSPGCCRTMMELVQGAAERGITISFDLNYRAKLWSPEEARHTLEPILPLVHLLFAGSDDARVVLGIEGTPEAQVRELARRYPAATVVVTAGKDGAWAWDGEMRHGQAIEGIEVDRIGRGDAFCAGYIFGSREGRAAYGLACGAALAALAQTYEGDAVWTTRDDVEALARGALEPRFR